MPIFMDRHDVSENVSAEILAEIHQEDLKIEKDFNCKGFTYWFDGKRKHVFCLIEAPNKEAIEDMHRQAHGDVPNTIIEVEPDIVESFLGRISDPENKKNTSLNIIEDSAFRILMVVKVNSTLQHNTKTTNKNYTKELNNCINDLIQQNQGTLVKKRTNYYLISFTSAAQAVSCALRLNLAMKPKHCSDTILKIGIASGDPVTNKAEIFEDTIMLTNQLCEHVDSEITITYEVKTLYENEKNIFIKSHSNIRVLLPSEEKFLTSLIQITEHSWQNPEFNIDDFSENIGYSKSQLYRKLTNLTGKSPNSFIKDFRLNRAKYLLEQQKGNISEIAFETGFNSLAYFSKCFKNKFNILPSQYLA
ncbi:nickel-binding protein [Formosa sp. S-31]|uniref:nickel-binding protein n=1 Tax=Formosa sp. S-31 TaxID=2790949 RepID=UPI003EB6B565